MTTAFTNQETVLIATLMKNLNSTLPVYYTMLEKQLYNTLTKINNNQLLATTNGKQLVEDLLLKIQTLLVDKELEELLTEKTPSTKIRSLERVRKVEVATIVYNAISSSEVPISRSEIAERTGLRLSSVTGRVNELLKEGRIEVTGEKLDKNSDRRVETLSTIPIGKK